MLANKRRKPALSPDSDSARVNRCFSKIAIRTPAPFFRLIHIEGSLTAFPAESHGELFAIPLLPGDIGACHQTSDL
jgi:hypothetical protein